MVCFYTIKCRMQHLCEDFSFSCEEDAGIKSLVRSTGEIRFESGRPPSARVSKQERLDPATSCGETTTAGMEHQHEFTGEVGVSIAASAGLRALVSGKSIRRWHP